MRLPRRRVLLAALPLVLVTGVALAAQPGGRQASSAVIHACVNKKTGLVRIVAASASAAGESSMTWNAQGARGAERRAGRGRPAGPRGPRRSGRPKGDAGARVRRRPGRTCRPAGPGRDLPAPRCPRSRA